MSNEETLNQLHNSLIKILDEIDRICRKYKIQYFLDSGTALGAIRHGGFIPWDDDADVGMFRDDYERFLSVAKKELNSCFFLQNQDTEEEYSQFNSKIRLNNTYFPESRNEGTKLHQGVFVDIFPFDYISDDSKEAKKDVLYSRKMIKMFTIRHRRPLKENIVRKTVRVIFSIFPEDFFRKKCLCHFLKYSQNHTNHVASYSYKMNSTHFLWFKVGDMYPSIDVEFEGRKYMIMNNWDAYLRRMYGDYMKLPPEEHRVWHFEGKIKFE